MNNTKKNRLPLYIGIPVILLLIFLRFGLYFLKSDGFSGLSMLLPILLLFILFALCTAAFFAAWVYQDCKKRGDDPVLWAIVVFIATPFIGLLIYFLRRSEIKATCPACGHRISMKAKYCEECGTHIENREANGVMVKQGTHHLTLIVAGIVSMVLMLMCLTGFKLPEIQAGENVLEITLPYGKTINVEACYLLGNFSVYIMGTKIIIDAPVSRMHFGDMTRQGLPFYGGNLTWLLEPDMEEGTYVLQVSQYRGHLLRVTIDGNDQGVIAFSPYQVRFSVAHAGKHQIQLTLFGSRVNTFGQVHNANKQTEWWGPESWRMTGILPLHPATSRSMFPDSRASHLKLLSSSGIAAGKAAWKKHSSRCTWPVYLCAGWRILPKLYGVVRYLRQRSVS